jgi:hypothetical protein
VKPELERQLHEETFASFLSMMPPQCASMMMCLDPYDVIGIDCGTRWFGVSEAAEARFDFRDVLGGVPVDFVGLFSTRRAVSRQGSAHAMIKAWHF